MGANRESIHDVARFAYSATLASPFAALVLTADFVVYALRAGDATLLNLLAHGDLISIASEVLYAWTMVLAFGTAPAIAACAIARLANVRSARTLIFAAMAPSTFLLFEAVRESASYDSAGLFTAPLVIGSTLTYLFFTRTPEYSNRLA